MASAERRKVEIIKEYCLIDSSESTKKAENRISPGENRINPGGNGISPGGNRETPPINPQSKMAWEAIVRSGIRRKKAAPGATGAAWEEGYQ